MCCEIFNIKIRSLQKKHNIQGKKKLEKSGNSDFELLFKYPYVPTFLVASGKKGTRPKWTISKYVLDNSKKCLSVDNFGIMSVCRYFGLSVLRLQPTTAYVDI